MSRYLYKKIQNISPESLNFQHSGLKLTTLGSDPESLISWGLTPRGYSQYLLQGQYLKNHSFFCPYLLKLTMINIQGLLHMKVRQSLSNG